MDFLVVRQQGYEDSQTVLIGLTKEEWNVLKYIMLNLLQSQGELVNEEVNLEVLGLIFDDTSYIPVNHSLFLLFFPSPSA